MSATDKNNGSFDYHDGIRDASKVVSDAMREEVAALRAIVDDPDTVCSARDLRRERIRTMEYVASLADGLIDWDWSR